MVTCPYCKYENSNGINFCAHCFKQIHCLNRECNSLLAANAPICLVCGQAIKSAEQTVQSPMNEFTREVYQTSTTYREKTQIRASDAVAGQYAPYVGGMPGRMIRPDFPPARSVPSNQPSLPLLADADSSVAALPSNPLTETSPIIPSHSEDEGNADKILAFELFSDTGSSELVPNDADFKGKTKKDQLVRFLVAYVWSYVHIFSMPVPSAEHLLSAAKRAGLYDANYSKYFEPTVKQYMLEVEKMYRMKPVGNTEVKRISEEMKNSSEQGFPYWKGSSRPGKRTPRLTQIEQAKIEEWIAKPVAIGHLDVRQLHATQQALFAVWSLTKVLKVAQAVKPRLAFEYISKKYTTISSDSKSFARTFSRSKNTKFFGKNSEGSYYLKDEAEKEIEKWIGGVAPDPDDGENDDNDESNDINTSEEIE